MNNHLDYVLYNMDPISTTKKQQADDGEVQNSCILTLDHIVWMEPQRMILLPI